MKTGFILGKFYPPHKGHEYLIEFASNYVDQLIVLVCSTSEEKISGWVRKFWLFDQFRKKYNVNILLLDRDMPQEPSEHPDFWNIWRNAIHEQVKNIDFVFASEPYGERLAQELNAKFIGVDIKREIYPVSGTLLRNTMYANNRIWNYLIDTAKEGLQKTICIGGPESTGKSTMTKILANTFGSTYIPEYGRTYYEHKKEIDSSYQYKCEYEDLEIIGRGHRANIKSLKGLESSVRFVDTDAITTKLFGEVYFGKYPEILDEFIEEERYDLTFVLAPNTPYVEDGMRDLPNERKVMFDRYITELTKQHRKFIIIDAENWDNRVQWAVSNVRNLLAQSSIEEF